MAINMWRKLSPYLTLWASLGLSGKEPACQCRRRGLDSLVGKIPWRRKWQPAPVFVPGEFCGQRDLAGYSPMASKSQTRLNDSTTTTPHCTSVSPIRKRAKCQTKILNGKKKTFSDLNIEVTNYMHIAKD